MKYAHPRRLGQLRHPASSPSRFFRQLRLESLESRRLLTVLHVVDSTADVSDGVFSAGEYSLREAIEQSNQTAGLDQIEFAPQLNGHRILLSGGELDITDDLVIEGPGSDLLHIDAHHASGVFTVDAGANVIISHLAMENGNGSDGSGVANFGSLSLQDVALRGHFGFEGGALYNQGALEIFDSLLEDNSADYGGGVENYGTLFVSGSRFVNNSAYEGGAIDNYEGTAEIHNSVFEGNSADSGGAISNYTTLAISDTTITDNAADFEGGGIYNAEGSVLLTAIHLRNNIAATDGGGLYSEDGSVLMQSSWVADNHGRSGGGIFTIDSSVTVAQSTIIGNVASRDGGGISSDSSVSAVNAELLVTASTIAGNTGTYGGGIDSVFTDTTIVNSTLSGNQARRDGGGIHNYGLLHVSHSTITANQADFDGDDNLSEGGGIFSGVGFQPRAVLANTIVAGNTNGLSSLPDDIGGLVDPLGSHNLIGDAATSGGLVDASAGNIVGNLGTGTRDIATILDVQLTDNGGPTWTHALVPGSSAIDAASSTLTLDQRGSARMLDGSGDGQATSDIGAYEFVSLTGFFTPIQQQIQSLGEAGTLSRGEQQRLLMFLGLAQRNIERTNLDTAIHFLELFRSHVEQMTESASTDGLLSLRSAASQITEHLTEIRDEHRAVDELFADFVFSWD